MAEEIKQFNPEKSYNELRIFAETLDERLKKMETPSEVPVKEEEPFVDVPFYPILKVDKLYAGLPIFTATPTHNAKQGETVLVDDGSSTRKICSYMNGTWRCQDFAVVSVLPAFYEIDSVGHNLAERGAWEDWDISDSIPVGTIAVQIYIWNAADIDVGVRKNGSSAAPLINDPVHAYATVGVGTDRIVEVYAGAGEKGVEFILTGYWK